MAFHLNEDVTRVLLIPLNSEHTFIFHICFNYEPGLPEIFILRRLTFNDNQKKSQRGISYPV